MDRRVNACRHRWDYKLKVCLRCNLTLHRYHSSKSKRSARAAHRQRERKWEEFLRQRCLEEED